MFETLVNADDRSQVGIETLIIFIAMILVAAIAAGILINTAGFLQNKASATSRDSTEQVSNQLIVISAVGEVNASGTNVTSLNFTVMQSPGADEIDLAAATIEWIGPHGHVTLSANDPIVPPLPGPPVPCFIDPSECFIVFPLKDVDSSAPVLNERSDRFAIHIVLGNATTAPAYLQGGGQATVKFVTQSGSSFTYVVNTPESLSSDAGSAVSV